MKRYHILIAVLTALFLLELLPSPSAAGKKELEAIQQLTSEVLVMQRQIRDLQESHDRTTGQFLALLNQVSDNVAQARQSLTETQTRVRDLQSTFTSRLDGFDNRFRGLDSNFQIVTGRLTETLDQIQAVKQDLATIGSKAMISIDPTDPVLVFSMAYGDYLKGNYQLAIDQFRQFLLKFPQSEQADDAQFWIGESFFSQGVYDLAIDEFNYLLTTYPNGDRAPTALLKKGFALLARNQTDEGVQELRSLIQQYPESAAAVTARQRLEELGVPAIDPKRRNKRSN